MKKNIIKIILIIIWIIVSKICERNYIELYLQYGII